MDNSKDINILNDLLHIANDRIRSYSAIEENVWQIHSNLKEQYDHKLRQSYKMKDELINMIYNLGGKPDDHPTIFGSIHQNWIELKNNLNMMSDDGGLKDIIDGEEAAISAYQKALDNGNLTPEIAGIVLDHLHHLKASYKKLDDLNAEIN
ncbi:PA2169 family four-helix-bundle protein [Epilithonimonas sp.]|uniref:PA2169 family four-helix-bundle protein n=1 Tax=Epilithonimonas sp. TaxID=2894511 RepID=UPI00289BD770|nr:PA2169 family four-helix-bundle protein [Epilithonimonas sp.]